MKRGILFVDDEENVLQGLKRSLRSMRRDWDMHFAVGGEKGLEMLAQQTIDIVVSDMRMPGMDGVTFLSKVRDQYPRAVRFALSGYSEKEYLLESAGICHQYLAKPCDPEELKEKIYRTVSLQSVLRNDAVKTLVSQIKVLPSAPNLYQQITVELQGTDPSIKRVSEIISQDAAMTAKVLQMVNSAFFGIPQHVSDAVQATKLLGIDIIKRLVLTTEIFSQFEQVDLRHLKIEKLWDHCFMTGLLAKEIAGSVKADKKTIDHGMIGGILHDVGKLIIAKNYPNCYLNPAEATDGSAWLSEQRTLGATHAEVGAYLMGLWGLPTPVVEAVALHHQPVKLDCHDFVPLTAVHVANALLNESYCDKDQIPEHRHLDQDYIAGLGLESKIPDWRQLCCELLDEVPS